MKKADLKYMELFMAALKNVNFEQLNNTVAEMHDVLRCGVISPEIRNKVYSLNFTIIMAAQNGNISFAEYVHLLYDLGFDLKEVL